MPEGNASFLHNLCVVSDFPESPCQTRGWVFAAHPLNNSTTAKRSVTLTSVRIRSLAALNYRRCARFNAFHAARPIALVPWLIP